MSKVKFYLFAAIVFSLLGPFFIVGAIAGQFIGSLYYGYKSGRESYLNIIRDLRKKVV